MKNAIITEKAIIPFETISTIVKIEGKWKLTLKAPIRHGNMPDSITEKQRQEYINWLENKDKQFIHEDDYGNTDYDPVKDKDLELKINEFNENDYKTLHDTKDKIFNVKTGEFTEVEELPKEEDISVMDFIEHMIDNYEVKIEISRDRVGHLHLEIEYEETKTFNCLILNGYREIFKGDTKKAKSLMNNEDNYFKERE